MFLTTLVSVRRFSTILIMKIFLSLWKLHEESQRLSLACRNSNLFFSIYFEFDLAVIYKTFFVVLL